MLRTGLRFLSSIIAGNLRAPLLKATLRKMTQIRRDRPRFLAPFLYRLSRRVPRDGEGKRARVSLKGCGGG